MHVDVVVPWERDTDGPIEKDWSFVLRRKDAGLVIDDPWRCAEDECQPRVNDS